MAMLQLFTMSGAEQAFTSTLLSALTSGLISNAPLAASMTFWTYETRHGAFTRMMYDAHEDALVVTNGTETNPRFIYPGWVYNVTSSVSITGINRQPTTHVLLRGDTLHPAGSAGSGGDIVAQGAAQQFFPRQGGALGMSWDPNTDRVYQHFWHFAAASRRGGGSALPYGYAGVSMFTLTGAVFAAGFWVEEKWDGVVNNSEQVIASAMLTTALAGRVFYAIGSVYPPLPAVFLDDVVVFVYGDLRGNSWISCRARPATESTAWRGTRSMPFGWPFALCPMGVDRVIALWWATPTHGSNLVYTVFRYDRTIERLRLEDVGTVPTSLTYVWPQHAGYATYDARRGRLLLLSPNPNDVHALVLDAFCHPGTPREAAAAVPLDPAHAGYGQRFAALTYTTATTLAAPRLAISYPGFASTDLTRSTTQFATDGVTGAGTFAVSWASGASGVSGTVVLGFSTYSVGISATYSQGLAYGTEGMALLTSTATFTVSTTLSAATATSAIAAVTITPRIAVSQADMVGAGSPRLLSYPTSALATPYLYALNPQQWRGIGANAWTPPLYQSQRTLSKTTTVQFAGDVTDLEVVETWMGGGNRIAMPLSMFAALWDYFANPPDLASAGYVTYEPRDITARKFKVLLTGLTVGGADGVQLDHLYKAGNWVHETVELTMRLVEDIS